MGMGSRYSQSASSRYASSSNGGGGGYGNNRNDDNDGDRDQSYSYHDTDAGFDDVTPMGGCDDDQTSGEAVKEKKTMDVVGTTKDGSDHPETAAAVKSEPGQGLSQDDSGFQKISLSKTTKKLKVNEAPVAVRAGSASAVALSSQRGGVSASPLPSTPNHSTLFEIRYPLPFLRNYYPCLLSTHLLNPPYQPTLSTHPIHPL